jgi:colanic acid biosynthesis glycosyl transferase WcaI
VRILIISSNYYPEPMGIGPYTTDLAQMLIGNGDDVTVITSHPYYPWWHTPNDLLEFAVPHSTIDGVRVYRTPVKFWFTSTTLGRILFEVLMWLGLRKVYTGINNNDFEKIISVIPSLGAGLVARKAAKECKALHYLIIQDITANGASESGMSFGTILQRLIFPIERLIVTSAKSIAVISQSMITPVVAMSRNLSDVTVLPNYQIEIPKPSRKFTRGDFNLPLDKFVIIHAGSIAKKQDLHNLVKTARLLTSTDVVFYLFGHGNAEEEILNASEDLCNFFIRPPVSRERFSSLLSCADLLIVNERPTQMSMSLPSKLISYFSSGVPVIGSVPKLGATQKAIEGLAFWVEAGEPQLLANRIREIVLSESEREFYSNRALLYFQRNLQNDQGRKRYLAWLMDSRIS